MTILNNTIDSLLKLISKKKEILTNILDISSNRSFSGVEDEIDDFISYLEIRQPYFDELASVNSKISGDDKIFAEHYNNKSKLHMEVYENLSAVKSLSKEITAIDKKNNTNMDKLLKELGTKIRTIRKVQHGAHSYDMVRNSGLNSVHIDSKS